ncbi:MAG: glycosyltransferase [Terriglobales bacterium]
MTGGVLRRLRVLHCSNADARGGAEEHMLTLLRGLDRERFAPALACPAALLAQLPDLPPDLLVTTLAPMHPWDVACGARLTRWLRRHQVDVVHAHLSCASRAVAPWARLARTPVFLETPHVRESWRRGWKRARVLDRIAGRLVHAYIAVSGANARYLRDEVRLPAAKIHLIRNGIDVARFNAPARQLHDPRPELGIAPTELVVLCSARLEPQKGHAVLLQALAWLPRPIRSRLRLVCLGTGSLEAELRRQIEALGLERHVILAGYCRTVESWLAAADIFALPSLYEGLPLSAMEASAAGCPIVATAVDGTPEVVADEVNGLLVPPGSAGALAAALLRLAADSTLRAALGDAGRRRARREFDQQRQIAATAQLYMDCCRTRGCAAPATAALPAAVRRTA